jgi:hypothetical protein
MMRRPDDGCDSDGRAINAAPNEAAMNDIWKMLNENAVLPLWPETGKVLRLRRGATYAGAKSGEIKTIRIGRLMRVPTSWLKAKLGIEPEAA